MFDTIRRMTDTDLTAAVVRLARQEKRTAADLIEHLGEFDARRLHLAEGYPSLFAYCVDQLGLSEGEAYNRIEVARASRRVPRLLEALRRGALSVTTARMLAPQLATESDAVLIDRASGRTKREVELLLARANPIRTAPPAVVVPVRVGQRSMSDAPGTAKVMAGPGTAGVMAVDALDTVSSHASGDDGSAPDAGRESRAEESGSPSGELAADMYVIRFTASTACHENLRFAQDLLRHVIPSGDVSQVIERALATLVEDLVKRRFAVSTPAATRASGSDAVDREPESAPEADGKQRLPGGDAIGAARIAPELGAAEGASPTRYISADVRRAVFLRDQGRCTFVAASGRRCASRDGVEFHHVAPFAAGGPSTVTNVTVRCRAHNRYDSDLYYGPILRNREALFAEKARIPGKDNTVRTVLAAAPRAAT